MKIMERNKSPFYYLLYKGKEPAVNEDGDETGEMRVSYAKPVRMRANVSAATGYAQTEQFGNYDKYFNVDNPKSAINFLETGQEMEIYYGYQLPDSDEIEWIIGNHLLCSEWESDDFTATIRCQDIFRNMNSEYYKGVYSPAGKSYYDLAREVLLDAGVTKFYIDPRLKRLYTKNPLPRVQHKEALQIIANACRCVLSQTRQGTPQIKSSFNPEATISVNAEAPFSHIQSVLNNSTKDEYAKGLISQGVDL